MSFFKTLPADAGPPVVYQKYPDVYLPWSEMSEAAMNGPSPLSPGEREMIFAYAAGLTQCMLPSVAHSEVAYARGIERGLVERFLDDPESATSNRRIKALMAYVRKLQLTPSEINQADVDAVLDAGWDEQALHDAIVVTARAAFMSRFVSGHGFKPPTREKAAQRAKERIEHGYVNLFPAFRKNNEPTGEVR